MTNREMDIIIQNLDCRYLMKQHYGQDELVRYVAAKDSKAFIKAMDGQLGELERDAGAAFGLSIINSLMIFIIMVISFIRLLQHYAPGEPK